MTHSAFPWPGRPAGVSPHASLPRVRLSVAAALAITLGGCALDHTLDGATDSGPVALDAATDSGPVALDGGPITVDTPSRTWLLYDVELDPDDWVSNSFDLDDSTTVDATTVSCDSYVVIPDGPEGEDNIFARYFLSGFEVARGIDDLQAYAREALRALSLNPLIHLEDWNGTENDSQVRVWFGAGATTTGAPWAGSGRSAAAADDFADADLAQPISLDNAASIVDGVLLADIPTLSLFIAVPNSTEPLEIILIHGKVSAVLGPEGLEDVRIGGAWPVSAAEEELDDLGICARTEERIALDLLFRQFADILTLPNGLCAGISVGVGYRGVPVDLAPETEPLTFPEGLCD